MRHVPMLLNAGRLTTWSCALVLGMAAQAWAGTPDKAKESKASGPVVSPHVSEPPSLALLALGLVGIGLHGLNRTKRHR